MGADELVVDDKRPFASSGAGKPGAVTALVGSPDSRIWAGFKHGRLEVYASGGRLAWKKVCACLVLKTFHSPLRTCECALVDAAPSLTTRVRSY